MRVCGCARACEHVYTYMYVGYDVGVSCVATVVVTDCLWPQQHLGLINLSSTRQQLSDSILNFSTIFPLCHWGPPWTPISDISCAVISTFVITCMI